jgi:hypothetical protein
MKNIFLLITSSVTMVIQAQMERYYNNPLCPPNTISMSQLCKGGAIQLYKCQWCQQRFTDEGEMGRHMYDTHKGHNIHKKHAMVDHAPQISNTRDDNQYETIDNTSKLLNTHGDTLSNNAAQKQKKRKRKQRLRVGSAKKPQLVQVPELTIQKAYVKWICDGQNRYRCIQCNQQPYKLFTRAQAVEEHYLVEHIFANQATFHCMLHEQGCSSFLNFKTHVSTEHSSASYRHLLVLSEEQRKEVTRVNLQILNRDSARTKKV